MGKELSSNVLERGEGEEWAYVRDRRAFSLCLFQDCGKASVTAHILLEEALSVTYQVCSGRELC